MKQPIDRDHCLSRRISLLTLVPEKELSPASVVLLSQMLPPLFTEPRCRENFAGLRFLAEPVFFSGRPSLRFSFLQTEDPSLSFLLRNPYQALEKEFRSFLASEVELTEDHLRRAKRLSLRREGSAEILLSSMKADGAPVVASRESLSALRLEEARESLSLLSCSGVAQSVFFGTAKNPSTFSFAKPERNEGILLEDLALGSDVPDETLLLDVRHSSLRSLSDVDSFLLFFHQFQREVSLLFRRMMLAPISYSFHPVDSNRTLLLLTFPENNLSLLRGQLPFAADSLPYSFDLRKEDVHRVQEDWILFETEEERFRRLLLSLSLWDVEARNLLERRPLKKDSAFFDSVTLARMVLACKR